MDFRGNPQCVEHGAALEGGLDLFAVGVLGELEAPREAAVAPLAADPGAGLGLFVLLLLLVGGKGKEVILELELDILLGNAGKLVT